MADPVAAVVHSAMGAGAAVLFDTTGQVSGAYAAIVVGISAPVILTQLGRVQSVSDAVTGVPQAAEGVGGTAEGSPRPVPPAQRPSPIGAGSPSRPAPPVTVGPPQPPTAPFAAASVDETRSDVMTTELRPNVAAHDPQSNGRPVEPAGGGGGGGGGVGGHEAPSRPHGPALGEEETT